jgi:hypothetical protein
VAVEESNPGSISLGPFCFLYYTTTASRLADGVARVFLLLFY